MIRRVLPILLTFLLLINTFLITHVLIASDGNSKPIVVCSTSVLASIVRDLASDKVIVEIIASPAICPAHYDVKPSDVDKVRRASLILYHGFEPWIKELYKASGSKAPLVRVSGPWNTPKFLKDRYVEVANVLRKYLGIDVTKRLNKCLESIDKVASWLKKYSEDNKFIGTPVVVMLWQKGFISYLGFKIVATYPPPEKVTPKLYQEIISNATKYHALLVVDNLQSGTDLGEKIASEVGAIEVALTNFPYVTPNVKNITQMMLYNAKLLAKALSIARMRLVIANISSEVRNISSEWRNILTITKQELNSWRLTAITSICINIALLAIVVILILRLRKR